jgi:hypothetical protein
VSERPRSRHRDTEAERGDRGEDTGEQEAIDLIKEIAVLAYDGLARTQ